MRLLGLVFSIFIILLFVYLFLKQSGSILNSESPVNVQTINRNLNQMETRVDKYNQKIEDLQQQTNEAIK